MGIADELEKLDQLRSKGALTDEEFVLAKSRLLAAGETGALDQEFSLLRQQVQELRRQNELARIDREWEFEENRFRRISYSGKTYLPTMTMGVVVAISGSVFGLFWMATAKMMPGIIQSILPVAWDLQIVYNAVFAIGAILTCLSALRGIMLCWSAASYRRAYRAYCCRREQALA